MSRTWSARSSWNRLSSAANRGSDRAMILMARSAALRAPLTATVATGMPFGIWTMASSESSPPRLASATGTPITAGGGDDDLDAGVDGPASKRDGVVRGPVGREHPHLHRDPERAEGLDRVVHDRRVRGASHDDGNGHARILPDRWPPVTSM